MLNIYTVYKCRTCNKEFILLTEDVDSMPKDRYLSCPYCNSKRLSKGKSTNDLNECMKEHCYRRVGRALRQIR